MFLIEKKTFMELSGQDSTIDTEVYSPSSGGATFDWLPHDPKPEQQQYRPHS